jgi:Zn-dependent protease
LHVILAEPPRTAFDLNFQVLGFPVRIHPLFWVVGFVLGFHGFSGDESAGIGVLVWMLVLFVSILVHELGHAILIRRFGRPAHIVLYMMGGLAIEGEDQQFSSWSSYAPSNYGRRSRTPAEQIIISFAGPAAGFLLAALVLVGIKAAGGELFLSAWPPFVAARLGGALGGNENLQLLVDCLLFVNIFWGLVNLLPVFPLDGGQIAMQLLIVNDAWGGTIKALWLSVFVGAAVAVVAGWVFGDLFAAMFFASLAVSNYFTLQQASGGGGRPW